MTELKGLRAIRSEMARQQADALASLAATPEAAALAASLRRTGRLLLLGMGASHAAGRTVEPLYRALGIDAIAMPLSEQLDQPLSLAGRTVILTSQSGESGEVVRWLDETTHPETFGISLDPASTLARRTACLVAHGGPEKAFAATRSLTLSLALHAPVLAALGADIALVRAALQGQPMPDLAPALAATAHVATVVTSARRLQGLAEALALGLTELSRRPCFALESGQLRHGPMEMLGPDIATIFFAADDPTTALVKGLAEATAAAGSPTVLFDASGTRAPTGVNHVPLATAEGLPAALTLLAAAQSFMVAFAAARVADVGTPVRSSKITRIE